MTLGERIQEKRKELGMSQEALGEALGVTRQSISKWESDVAIPELDKLIALSRLFRVSVGELLGVEEDGPAWEELTDRELKALEAIAAKLTPPAPEPDPVPPKKKKRWPKVLAACAAAAVAVTVAGKTADRLERLEQQVGGLQSNVNAIDHNISLQVNSIAGRVEQLLEEQNRVAADMGYELVRADVKTGVVEFRVWATPRTWREGMTAQFSARAVNENGEFPTVEVPGTEGEGHRFEALVSCGFTDDITLAVTFVSGEESQNQIVSRVEGLHSGSLPRLDAGAGVFSADIREEEGAWRLQMDFLTLFADPGHISVGKEDVQVDLAVCELRLWRGDEMIWSKVVDPFPDGTAYQHLDLGIDLPLPDLKEGEVFYLSARFCDTEGRWFETLLDAGTVQPGTIVGGKITRYDLAPDGAVPEDGYPWGPEATVQIIPKTDPLDSVFHGVLYPGGVTVVQDLSEFEDIMMSKWAIPAEMVPEKMFLVPSPT